MPVLLSNNALDVFGFSFRVPDNKPEIIAGNCMIISTFSFEQAVKSEDLCPAPSGYPGMTFVISIGDVYQVTSDIADVEVIIIGYLKDKVILTHCSILTYHCAEGRCAPNRVIEAYTSVQRSVATPFVSKECGGAEIRPSPYDVSKLSLLVDELTGLPLPTIEQYEQLIQCGSSTEPISFCDGKEPGIYILAKVSASHESFAGFEWSVEQGPIQLPFKIACEAIPSNILDMVEWGVNAIVDELVDNIVAFLSGKVERIAFRLIERITTRATFVKLALRVTIDEIEQVIEDALTIDVQLKCCPGNEPEHPDEDGREYPEANSYEVILPRTSAPGQVVKFSTRVYERCDDGRIVEDAIKVNPSGFFPLNGVSGSFGTRTFTVSDPSKAKMVYSRTQALFVDEVFAKVSINGIKKNYARAIRGSLPAPPRNYLNRSGWRQTEFAYPDVVTIEKRGGKCKRTTIVLTYSTLSYQTFGPDMIIRDANGRLIRVERAPETTHPNNPDPDFDIPDTTNISGQRYRISIRASVSLLPMGRKRPSLTDQKRIIGQAGELPSSFGVAIETVIGISDFFDVDIFNIPVWEVCTDLPQADLIADLVSTFSGLIIPGIGPVSVDIGVENIGPC